MSTAVDTFGNAGRNATSGAFDVTRIRRDFPILRQSIHGRPLVYLDNAASAQKPQVVIDAVSHFYENDNANIHRGVHSLSVRATDAYERARAKSRDLLGAAHLEEVIFVRGASEAVNLVAQTYGRQNISEGDEIVISEMEHHSNIVPWQILCQQTGATLRVVPISDEGELLIDEYKKLLGQKTKIVAITHVSNAIGTINPIREIVELAHGVDAVVLVDGAQAVPHLKVDVREIDCDFYTFSGHKFFGPTGVGILFGKKDLLEQMPPYQGGGEMIRSVTFAETTYNDLPHRFEAGTPNIAGGVALGASIDYVNGIGMDAIVAHEDDLLEYATVALSSIAEVRLVGTAQAKVAVLSFVIDGIHPHDAGTILDQQGIAIRTGHHCAQPLMDRFNVPATCRASLTFYNTREEIDALTDGIQKMVKMFQ